VPGVPWRADFAQRNLDLAEASWRFYSERVSREDSSRKVPPLTSGDFAGASERLGIAVAAPLGEYIRVSTSLNVKRYDADQTAWALRRLGFGDTRPPLALLGRGITPAEFASAGIRPYSETQEDDCNMVVQQGWVWLLGGIAGTSITNKFSATYGRIGVGTSSTAAAYAQSYLQGDTGSASTTSYYQLCGAGPTISTGSTPPTLVFTASFAGGNANFAWNEFGTDNANASGVYLNGLAGGYGLLNRGVSAQGTKASGQTWTATETLTFGFAASPT
jgi:hypothetical protein